MADTATDPRTGGPPTTEEARGQRILVLLGAFGYQTHAALVEQFGDLEVVGNAQVLAICELALRGSLRPRDIQAAAGMTSGGTTKLLDHLETLGLIERAYGRTPGDRRGVAISLTSDGRDVASRMAAAIESRIDLVRSLSNELSKLVEAG